MRQAHLNSNPGATKDKGILYRQDQEGMPVGEVCKQSKHVSESVHEHRGWRGDRLILTPIQVQQKTNELFKDKTFLYFLLTD